MKKYEEFEIELIFLAKQDIVTMSSFDGEEDEGGFGNPNKATEVGNF